MGKQVKFMVVWFATVVLFNLIIFLAPVDRGAKSEGFRNFWVVYGLLMAAFVLHLIFSCVALSEKNKEKRALNMPLIVISCTGLFLMTVTGMICMAVPGIPKWISIVVCYAVLLFFVVFLLSAKTVGETTAAANHELNRKTFSFRVLIDNASELVNMADTEEKKQIAQSVYDKVRYSDPVSDPQLANDEYMISEKMNELLAEYRGGYDISYIQSTANDLMSMVDRRNAKCKTLKRQV